MSSLQASTNKDMESILLSDGEDMVLNMSPDSIVEDSVLPNSSFKGLLSDVGKAADDIINKLHEGRSVTKTNKTLITDAAKKIKTILNILGTYEPRPSGHCTPRLTNQTSSENSNDADIIFKVREVVREEMITILKQHSPIQTPPSTPSFAEITRNEAKQNKKRDLPKNKPALIISSTSEVKSPAETMQKRRRATDFRNTNYSPAGYAFVSNNKIRVEFDNTEQRNETLKMINTKKDQTIKAEEARMLNPMFIIKGISKETTPESLQEIIIRQNDLNQNANQSPPITLKQVKNNKNPNLYNATFMTTPQTFREIIPKERININHQRVHVEEYIPILQCYNCMQIGHISSRCTKDHPTCSYCAAQTHTFKDCPVKNDTKRNSCINCTIHYQIHKINKTPPQHSATSNLCPRITSAMERLRTKINYG